MYELPEVNAFAVSNLLFPGNNILNFQDAYVPGDVVIFGDVYTPAVVVNPGSTTLGPAQTQQFSASGEDVGWSASVGTVSQSGLYTAPSSVSQVDIDQVVATGTKSGDAAAALITLVPQGAQLSPAFTLMPQGAQPQQFSAALAGAPNQEVTWSMEPQLGTLSAGGLYTPPTSVQSAQTVIITATSSANPSIRGTALVAVVASLPTLVTVTPPQTASPLTGGQAQQFNASTIQGQTVNWSLLPRVGQISKDGLYTAPETITAPQSVLLLATTEIPQIYGTALIILAPSQ